MINIIVAFKEEARPLIELLSLRPQPGGGPFTLYQHGGAQLLISGMGAKNAAAAARFLRTHPATADAPPHWFNFGIAGSAQFEPGVLVAASEVRQQTAGGGEQWPCRPPAIPLPMALVRTVAQPETAYGESGVYDLEAAGICRALDEPVAPAPGCAADMTCVKLVTDGPAQPAAQLTRKAIRQMLNAAAPQLAALLGAMPTPDAPAVITPSL